jgi:hypothetical protein
MMQSSQTLHREVDYWLAEKSVAALRALTRMVPTLGPSSKETLSQDEILDLRHELWAGLAYLATIVTASAGKNEAPFGPEVAEAIMKGSDAAMEDFLFELGLIGETTSMAETRRTCEILHPILPLLESPRSESRTLICSILIGYDGKSPIVRSLCDLTEDVTDGQINWWDYCERCRRLIATHACPERRRGETNETIPAD